MAGEEYTSLINFLKREGLTDRVAKVMCPQCASMIDVCCLECGCKPPRYVHILKGCGQCGMKFGEGKSQVHGVECETCGHDLDFFEKYPWRREYIGLKTGDSFIFKGSTIALFIVGCIIGFFLFMYLNQNNSQSPHEQSASRVQEQGISPEQTQPQSSSNTGEYTVPSTSQSTDGSPDQGETPPEEPQYGYRSSPNCGGPHSYSYSYHSRSYPSTNHLPSYSQSYHYYYKSYRAYSRTYSYPNQNPYPPQPYSYSAAFPYGH